MAARLALAGVPVLNPVGNPTAGHRPGRRQRQSAAGAGGRGGADRPAYTGAWRLRGRRACSWSGSRSPSPSTSSRTSGVSSLQEIRFSSKPGAGPFSYVAGLVLSAAAPCVSRARCCRTKTRSSTRIRGVDEAFTTFMPNLSGTIFNPGNPPVAQINYTMAGREPSSTGSALRRRRLRDTASATAGSDL